MLQSEKYKNGGIEAECNWLNHVRLIPWPHAGADFQKWVGHYISLPSDQFSATAAQEIVRRRWFPLALDGMNAWPFAVKYLAKTSQQVNRPVTIDIGFDPDIQSVLVPLQDQQIWACDPSPKFMTDAINQKQWVINGLVGATSLLVTVSALAFAAQRMKQKDKLNNSSGPTGMSRRKFLGLAGKVVGGTVVFGPAVSIITAFISSEITAKSAEAINRCQAQPDQRSDNDPNIQMAIDWRTRHITEVIPKEGNPTALLGKSHLNPIDLQASMYLNYLKTYQTVLTTELSYLKKYAEGEAFVYYLKTLVTSFFSMNLGVTMSKNMLSLYPVPDDKGHVLQPNIDLVKSEFGKYPSLFDVIMNGPDEEKLDLLYDLASAVIQGMYKAK